jgi:putative AlgH/UPF0301 family transcriptional regulator
MRWVLIAILTQLGLGQQIEGPTAKGVAAGTLLVATRKSYDADLRQSVVLLVHSGPEGVIGLIVNRPGTGDDVFRRAHPRGNSYSRQIRRQA